MLPTNTRTGAPKRVLLLGDARMAFPVAKALNRDGNKVFASVSVYSNYLEWSRHVAGSFRHPSFEPGTDAPLPYVLDWLDAHGPVDAIQPVSEAASRFLTRHRTLFQNRAALIMPEAETVATCMNKTRMFNLCEELGVALAPYVRVRDLAQLAAAIEHIGFPLIVKPAVVDAELFGRKALLIFNAEDLKRAMPGWPSNHPELLVQRFVTGPRHSVIFSADKGTLLGAVEIKAARTHEHDGTGYTTYGVTIEPTPRVREGVERLVRHLRYTSTGCAQFMVSPCGRDVTFMEVNPRVSLGRISENAGLTHSVWGLRLALGERVAPLPDSWGLKRGVKYVWTKGDLDLLIKQVRKGDVTLPTAARRLGQIGVDAVQCSHAIFDPLDPLPVIGTYANVLLKPLRRYPEYEARRDEPQGVPA